VEGFKVGRGKVRRLKIIRWKISGRDSRLGICLNYDSLVSNKS
jgi:hypothetical protein